MIFTLVKRGNLTRRRLRGGIAARECAVTRDAWRLEAVRMESLEHGRILGPYHRLDRNFFFDGRFLSVGFRRFLFLQPVLRTLTLFFPLPPPVPT